MVLLTAMNEPSAKPAPSRPKVFISYSHDSPEHAQRVLGLAERLRADGIETSLDQYINGSPVEGWPRWMLNQLDAADFVLLICTETYYRRFRGLEQPGKGKGADWEGALVTQEIYDARSATAKFVAVMFAPGLEAFVPEPLRGRTFHVLTGEESYQELYDVLLGQAGVAARPVGELKRRKPRRGAVLSFGGANARAGGQASVADNPALARVTLYDGDQALVASLDQAVAEVGAEDKQVCGGPDCVLSYDYSRKGKVVEVRPRLAYLEGVRRSNARIEGLVFTHQAFAWNFPRLAIRLANPSAAPIHLVEALLDVQSSEPVQEAIPVIRDMSYQSLVILNEGWQPMAQAEIEFEIAGLEEGGDVDLFLPERVQVQVPVLETQAVVPLLKYVPERLRQEQAVRVRGQLRFGPASARRTVDFVTRVELGLRAGHGVAPTHTYQVLLRAGETGLKRLSLAQEIPPGSVDLFLLTLGADRACRTAFDLRFLTLDDAEIVAERIDVEIFVPRNLKATGAGAIP
jgi:hypothetical protein